MTPTCMTSFRLKTNPTTSRLLFQARLLETGGTATTIFWNRKSAISGRQIRTAAADRMSNTTKPTCESSACELLFRTVVNIFSTFAGTEMNWETSIGRMDSTGLMPPGGEAVAHPVAHSTHTTYPTGI